MQHVQGSGSATIGIGGSAQGEVIRRDTMGDQLSRTIGHHTDMRRALEALEDKLFGDGSEGAVPGGPVPPMPEAIQWRVNEVASTAAGLERRLQSILDRL